jgi:hypothetical protein
MSTLAENLTAKTELGAGLQQGIDTSSGFQELTFILYVKFILPIDGSVFWVNGALYSDTALMNAAVQGLAKYNTLGNTIPARVFSAKGGLHIVQDLHQQEDSYIVYNHMMFSTPQPINSLNALTPNLIYVANNNATQFAFSQRDAYYKNADMYHYRGDALYSINDTQLIDSLASFDQVTPVVSNSLPIWLTLNQYFPMYPSYLTGLNNVPPYGVVHIEASDTQAYQFPLSDINSNPWQLTKDKVKITIFGKRNQDALNFINYVFQYSLNTDNIGLTNLPTIQDEKMGQVEFGFISQKKTITFEVSYYQTTANNIARELIKEAFITLTAV